MMVILSKVVEGGGIYLTVSVEYTDEDTVYITKSDLEELK